MLQGSEGMLGSRPWPPSLAQSEVSDFEENLELTRDRTRVSHICRQSVYCLSHRGSLISPRFSPNVYTPNVRASKHKKQS